ncbi:MAG: UDP-3-O-(3-hydroxymyristoyl)glucosamine N-acyltransferase [Planctomycetota bacterium]|nr:MAG: UDP-3-O-(3-hydroxymyristoyl)glucosamine N-acyltransferase [Planctomycetota bacterium]
MPTTLSALAQLVNGEVVGDPSIEIEDAATLLDAGPQDITLVDRNAKPGSLATAQARAVVVPRGFPSEELTLPAIVVEDEHPAFTTLVMHFRPPRRTQRVGISPQAQVDPTARLAADVEVEAGATVGPHVEIGPGSTIRSGARVMAGCRLGRDVTIHPNAVLYDDTRVGDRSVIHANVVLGCHGFGYRVFEGNNLPTAQLGWVEVGVDCEIGSCSTVDRGTYGPTLIGDGTKIDNLVMIAHNCRIGRHNMICSQVGVAGSTITGDYVVMAGQVGVRDHVRIGERAVLAAKAGVSCDVPDGAHMLGIPAIREREQKIQFAAISKLPEMRRQLRRLQRTLDEMAKRQESSPAPKPHAA